MPKSMLLSEVFPPRTGGSGRWFWELYRRLPRDEFAIVAGRCAGFNEFDRQHDLDIVRTDLTMPFWGIRSFHAMSDYLRLYRMVRRVSRERNASSLHAGRVLPEGWLAWMMKKSTGTPYLCYAHGEELFYGVESRELGWMMRRVFRGASKIIANSKNTRDLLHRDWSIPASKIAIVHPGVDTQRYVPAERDAASRRELGWSQRPVILSVGRLQERKGHDVMIRAIEQIRQQHADVLYAICGNGEQRQYLEQLARDLGVMDNVQFRDEVDDDELLTCYQQADLFVLANRTVGKDIEGFGIVLLEAQACGLPVIAGDSGGTAETMDVGHTGYIVNCDRHEPLVSVVTPLLADQSTRQEMGQAARQWVVANFEWQTLAEMSYDLLHGGHLHEPARAPITC